MPLSEQQSRFPISTYFEDDQNARPPQLSAVHSESLFPLSQGYSARDSPSNSFQGPRPDASDSFPITRYLEDEGDSRLPQHLALQSRLPARARESVRRPRAGTSLLLSGNDSLAALTTASIISSTGSVSSSLGERYLGPSRILEHDSQGALIAAPLRPVIVFECPFNFLNCLFTFDSFQQWHAHSLTHFKLVEPPSTNHCCFCDKVFNHKEGLQSWRDKMGHTALHHQLGHKLAHGQPDFQLYKYLWSQRLIQTDEYKELVGDQRSSGSLPTLQPKHEAPSNVPYTTTHAPRRIRGHHGRWITH